MDKKTLRNIYLEKRNAFSATEMAKITSRLTEELFTEIRNKKAKSVFVFIPIEGKKEFNTLPLIQRLWKENIQVTIPVSDFKTSSMKSALYSPETELAEKKYGILEPLDPIFVSSTTLELAIIPLLVSDEKKNRVGYGGGFYDRFLAKNPQVYKLGVSFFEPILEIEGLDKNDVALDSVIF